MHTSNRSACRGRLEEDVSRTNEVGVTPEMDTLLIALFEILSFGAIRRPRRVGARHHRQHDGHLQFRARANSSCSAPYITYLVHSAGLPVAVGMVAAPFAVGALGLVLERLVVRRFLRRAHRRDARHLCARLIIRESCAG